jgi:hypothetical protein
MPDWYAMKIIDCFLEDYVNFEVLYKILVLS